MDAFRMWFSTILARRNHAISDPGKARDKIEKLAH